LDHLAIDECFLLAQVARKQLRKYSGMHLLTPVPRRREAAPGGGNGDEFTKACTIAVNSTIAVNTRAKTLLARLSLQGSCRCLIQDQLF
jgi:hypothetical protein